eukprot:1180889-Prorocentrum_minimum.AAC.6
MADSSPMVSASYEYNVNRIKETLERERASRTRQPDAPAGRASRTRQPDAPAGRSLAHSDGCLPRCCRSPGHVLAAVDDLDDGLELLVALLHALLHPGGVLLAARKLGEPALVVGVHAPVPRPVRVVLQLLRVRPLREPHLSNVIHQGKESLGASSIYNQ